MVRRWYFRHTHQDKASRYIDALSRRFWLHTRFAENAEFLLTDRDTGLMGLSIEQFHSSKKPIFLYPHSAEPLTVRWDGMFEWNRNITAVFVHSRAGVEIPRLYGFDKPIHEVGWAYCRQSPFRGRTYPTKILFAPIHPNHNGWLSVEDKLINQTAFLRVQQLLKIFPEARVTVRYIQGLRSCGITQIADPRIHYVRGIKNLQSSVKAIDQADFVISHETFLSLAVARGIPSMGMGESVAPRLGHTPQSYTHARHWDLYRERMMFPLDILSVPEKGLEDLVLQALGSDQTVSLWRQDMIGSPFNGSRFTETIESYL